MKNKTTNGVDARFAGQIGQKYARILRGIPHILQIEKAIAVAARQGLPRKVRDPRMVLDLGCGSGLTTLALCQELNYAFILGVDNEPGMLDQYKQMRRGRSMENGVVIAPPVEKEGLKFLQSCKSESFEAVVSGFVLHNLPAPRREKIYREIRRVLKPGGRFVNGDKIAHEDRKLHDRALMGQIADLVRCYNNPTDTAYGLDWIEHYLRDNQPDLKQTESEVKDSLTAAGFSKVRITKRYGMDAVVVADR